MKGYTFSITSEGGAANCWTLITRSDELTEKFLKNPKSFVIEIEE
jgi:hypothetical protein